MKHLVLAILLSVGMSAAAAQATSAAADTSHSRTALSAEVTWAPGLNDYTRHAAQVAVVGSISLSRGLVASLGIGLRHAATLAEVDKNIYNCGEPDQTVYGDRLLLPVFVRVRGLLLPVAFTRFETRFTPFVQMDVGRATDLQRRAHQRTVSGIFMSPSAGLDIRLKSGRSWYLSLGLGIQEAQYSVFDYQGRAEHVAAVSHTGKALSFNFSLGHRF